ncbi:MAG: DEAD/DEAH box helicase family protein, partial [Clostridia bacterium]|nr:DEAD/DEAH box helicase family protein [Clostridia bacterium]
MKSFEKVKFNGVFRDYQKRVLDNSDTYLLNGKINIVAAPGSGKTILGLELIRKLNAPTIILSPTTTIKYQWGTRFANNFLDATEDVNDYFSYDLHEITLINSITYQALHSVMNKLSVEEDGELIDY